MIPLHLVFDRIGFWNLVVGAVIAWGLTKAYSSSVKKGTVEAVKTSMDTLTAANEELRKILADHKAEREDADKKHSNELQVIRESQRVSEGRWARTDLDARRGIRLWNGAREEIRILELAVYTALSALQVADPVAYAKVQDYLMALSQYRRKQNEEQEIWDNGEEKTLAWVDGSQEERRHTNYQDGIDHKRRATDQREPHPA